MTEVGQSVRTLVEFSDDYGNVTIPKDVVAMVIGHTGPRTIISWIDDRGEEITVEAKPSEVRVVR